MAEAILHKVGGGRFRAFSAGSHPTGRVNALTLAELARRGYPTAGLSSKSWLSFAMPDAPRLDFVVAVCDKVAAETAPAWNGHPMTLRWDFIAPGQVTGTDDEIRAAFSQVCEQVEAAVKEFVRVQA